MAMTPEVKAAVDQLLSLWSGSTGKGSHQRVIRDFTDAADNVPTNTSGGTDEQRLQWALQVLQGGADAYPFFSKKGAAGWESVALPLSKAYAPASKIYSEWIPNYGIVDETGFPDPNFVDYNKWLTIAPKLGYSGEYVYDYETGESWPNYQSAEFKQFVDQKRAEGYDFVSKRSNFHNYNNYTGFKLPSGEVVGQTRTGDDDDITSFFKDFLLPAGFAAFTMGGGLNALAGGGAGAGAGANALAGIAEGMVPGGLTAAGIPATAAELGAVGALTGGGLTLADIPTSGLGNVLGSGSDVATGAGGAVEAAGAATDALSALDQAALDMGAGATNVGKAGLTGIPVLDKAIDFVTSPGGAAIVSGAGNIIGGIAGANAAESAAETQAAAADRATALQREMYEKALELNKPYYEAGVNALGKLTRGEILPEPGYAFRLGEGMKALERVQAARGNMLSGGALKAGQRYAQDLASQEYGNAYNRLANIAGLGQTATTQAGAAGQNYASQAGELGLQGANALAQGRIGRQTSYTNALLGAAGALQDYVQAPMKEQMFRDIYGRLMGKP